MSTKTVFLFLSVCAYCGIAYPAQAKPRVLVHDEYGHLLLRTYAIQLARGRHAIAVVAYERIGLYVKRDFKTRRVIVALRESDSGIQLQADSRKFRLWESNKTISTHDNTKVAVIRRGKFYVNADILKGAFSDIFSTSWNSRTRTITLRRNAQYANFLRRLESQEKPR